MSLISQIVRVARHPRCRRLRVAIAGIVLFGLSAPRATTQTATEPALKAAFIYNFAKFTEWPQDSLRPGAPLVLCVAQDGPVERALEDATRERQVEGHPLVTKQMDLSGPIGSCHVLYVDAAVDRKRVTAAVDRLKGERTLTVSDLERFAESGGCASLFVEDGRMRFAVNLDAVQRAGLRLSSRLLTVAKIVKE
jgi:hypothetical protein